jgi:pilus assembly protein FimV
MLKRYLCQLLVLALWAPAASFALGLGDIHLKSALNAPLDAEIDVVGASADDLAGLKAKLASRDAFTKAGLDYPSYFATLKMTPEKTSDGRSILHVRSSDAVNEPFATLLVEADWARGHVVREYTVLIDPPVFSNTQNPNSASVAAPSTGATAHSGNVEHSVDHAATAAAGTAATATATPSAVAHGGAARGGNAGTGAGASAGNEGGSYTVRNGDTLSSVAAQNYPGSDHVARERQLVGIYRANPSAFEGNMNVLRAGSRLQLPGDAELQAISPGEASAEVRKQYQAWSEARGASPPSGSGQLHLVPPQETASATGAPSAATAAAAAGGGAAQAAGNAAMSQRVQQLEAQLAESQRLLQMRNDELAQLQARVSQSKPATGAAPAAAAPAHVPPAPTPAPAPSVPPAHAPAENAAPAPTPAPTPAPAPAATPTPPPAAAPAPAKPPAEAPAAAPSGTSFADLVSEYWYVLIGLVVLIAAAIFGLRHLRSRQEDDFDRSLGRLHPAFEGTQTNSALRSVDTMPVRTLPSSGTEQSYRVEESGAHEQPTAVLHDRTAEGPALTATEHVVIDDTVTGEHPVALDQGDPLAEADFHMAYGLYDQAADLVQIAMSREPDRRDLKLKLLEVFFVWGNKERFLQTARELAGTREQSLPGEWEKVVIMGRQIASEDPLFAGTAGLAAAASGGVDLNLEGGQNRVDFDLLGEPTASSEPETSNVGLDLDLGAALGDTTETRAADEFGESGVDFVLDDPERGNDSTGSTREMPEAPPRPLGATATMQVINAGNAPSDAPTVERPQLDAGENATIRQKIGAAARGGAATSDQTAELALDDLGLDLGALEGAGDETILQGGPDAPTMLAGLDEVTRARLSHADEDQDRTQVTPAPVPAPSESGTWLFTDSDLTDLVPDEDRKDAGHDDGASHPTEIMTQISAPPPLDSTGRMHALDSSGLDLDLGNPQSSKDSNGIDLDVGAPSAGETGTFAQTQRIAQGEVPLPELEPATMSEVGTKLDLARAYMDMGDPEGARSILSEVLTEGSVSQKQEARRLMDTLPG